MKVKYKKAYIEILYIILLINNFNLINNINLYII